MAERGAEVRRDPLLGRIVAGRYQLVRVVGHGGMGAVYEGIQLDLARPVAVKVLLDCDARALARFRQEALLVATIAHPNVVQVTDLVSDEDVPAAIVMELLDGESLGALLGREGSLAEDRAASIALQMLAGLYVAHERNIVHRDVKPSNVQIIRSEHGPEVVKMLDFGIAKSLERGGFHTTMGVVIGTPAYMAPEQILGEAVDARADIHAVGACLYEMLTGRRVAGDGTGPELARAVLTLDPGRILAGLGATPLAHVVARALAHAPSARWPDARAMAAAIDATSSSPRARAASRASGPAFDAPPAGRPSASAPPVAPATTPHPREPLELPLGNAVKLGDVLASKYRLDRVLGVGGMGVVVLATHLDLEQEVALKFLLPAAAAKPALVQRFMREARAAVRLKSPHVARTIDTSRLPNGCPYIVMEYLDGRDLDAELVARGPLPVQEAASYVLQACDALAEAHALGIVHRDLKPANLFLTRTHDGLDQVKVLDFGISKRLDVSEAEGQDASLTNAEMVFGSPAYMSPEQVRSSKGVDPRSDIWSVGIVLYELLTRQLPFPARTALEMVLKAHTDAPASPRVLRPEVPEALERIIFRCLEKDPARRYADVGELARALAPFAHPRDRVLAERTVEVASGTSGAIPERRPGTGGRPAVVAGALLTVALLALAGVRAAKATRVSPPVATASSPAASSTSASVPASSPAPSEPAVATLPAEAAPSTSPSFAGAARPTPSTMRSARPRIHPGAPSATMSAAVPTAEPDAGRFFRVRE